MSLHWISTGNKRDMSSHWQIFTCFEKIQFLDLIWLDGVLIGPLFTVFMYSLECGHLGEGRLGGLQVAGPPCLDLRRGFGTAVRVAAVLLCHGLDVTPAAHPPARDLIVFPQRRETAPLILGHLQRQGEITRVNRSQPADLKADTDTLTQEHRKTNKS